MFSRIAYLLLFFLFSSVSYSQELEFQLSDDMARIMYTSSAIGENYGRLELEVGFLYEYDRKRPSSDYL